jgi:hypothetical protein
VCVYGGGGGMSADFPLIRCMGFQVWPSKNNPSSCQLGKTRTLPVNLGHTKNLWPGLLLVSGAKFKVK